MIFPLGLSGTPSGYRKEHVMDTGSRFFVPKGAKFGVSLATREVHTFCGHEFRALPDGVGFDGSSILYHCAFIGPAVGALPTESFLQFPEPPEGVASANLSYAAVHFACEVQAGVATEGQHVALIVFDRENPGRRTVKVVGRKWPWNRSGIPGKGFIGELFIRSMAPVFGMNPDALVAKMYRERQFLPRQPAPTGATT